MNAAKTLTANYQLQYQLNLAVAPTAAGTPAGLITGAVDGQWFNSGATASVTATSDVGTSGSRYHFTAWSGASTDPTLATSVTMDAAKTLTANYQLQYQLSLATNPSAVGTSHITGASDG